MPRWISTRFTIRKNAHRLNATLDRMKYVTPTMMNEMVAFFTFVWR
jgi:hypothetical protein